MKKILALILVLIVAIAALAFILKKQPDKMDLKKDLKTQPANEKVEKKPELPSEETKAYNADVADYTLKIESYKNKLSDNIKKLSNKKWLNRSYDDLTGISSEDLRIIQENNSIVYYLQSAYLSSCSIKVLELNDKKGAKDDLNEFKKIIKGNKYIVQGDEMIRVIDAFMKKWDL